MIELKNRLAPEYEKIWRNKAAAEVNRSIIILQNHMTTLEKQEPILKNELKTFEDHVRLLGPNVNIPLTIINLRSKSGNLESSINEITKIIQKSKAEVVNLGVSVLQFAAEPKTKDYSRQVKFAGAVVSACFSWCCSASPSWNFARARSAVRMKYPMAWA